MGHACTALGHVERGRHPDSPRKVAIALDSDTFTEVRARAIRAGHSFAQETRILIEWGLEAANGTA